MPSAALGEGLRLQLRFRDMLFKDVEGPRRFDRVAPITTGTSEECALREVAPAVAVTGAKSAFDALMNTAMSTGNLLT